MYVLDSNVFIEAKNRYYGFDIAPGFWEWLEHSYATGKICSIKPVYDELTDRGDELAYWVKLKSHKGIFTAVYGDQVIYDFLSQIITWAEETGYKTSATQEFADCADPLLIAFAAVHGYTVVTHERPAPNSRNKIKIPDVCEAFGVEYCDTFTMFRSTGAQLVLRWFSPGRLSRPEISSRTLPANKSQLLSRVDRETIAAMLEAERIAKDPRIPGYASAREAFAAALSEDD